MCDCVCEHQYCKWITVSIDLSILICLGCGTKISESIESPIHHYVFERSVA